MRISIVVALSLVILASTAFAEGGGKKGQGCQAQISVACKETKGEERTACMQKNLSSFSPECRSQVEKKLQKSASKGEGKEGKGEKKEKKVKKEKKEGKKAV